MKSIDTNSLVQELGFDIDEWLDEQLYGGSEDIIFPDEDSILELGLSLDEW